MDPIYVTGHRNPDTDSIVAAMAYAALRQACGDREYEAARLGEPSDETMLVLNRFGFEPPKLIINIYNQVRNLEFDRPPVLGQSVTVGRAWDILLEHPNMAALPVAKEDGTLFGILSRTDVASYHLSGITNGVLENVPLFNVVSVLEGKILNETSETVDSVGGEIVIALPQSRESLLFSNPESIVLCGDQPDMIRRALEMNVSCLVLCQSMISEELRNLPTKTCIISTPFDAYQAARLLFQSVPISRVCTTEGIVSIHLEDRVDDVRELVLKHRHPSYPILDEHDRAVGVLTRYHLLRPRRKRVVLVDHNEARQSVPGLEEADILEIIDHHRLADIQTRNPIYVRNEPVGSTNTIIASMYQDRGILPSARMAGMMAAAILSDTVMFKSPTCTERDVRTAERLARIANISLEKLGRDLFSASVEGKSAEELLFADYKEFLIAGNSLAVAQIACVDSTTMLEKKAEFLELMRATAEKRHFDLMVLMITDVLLEGSHLLYVGDDDTFRQAFGIQPKDNVAFAPRIMSRKKQVVPKLSALWA